LLGEFCGLGPLPNHSGGQARQLPLMPLSRPFISTQARSSGLGTIIRRGVGVSHLHILHPFVKFSFHLGHRRCTLWRLPRFLSLMKTMCFRKVDCEETLWEFDLVKLRSQRLNDLLPIGVRRQAASRGTRDTMLAIQLNIKRIESMGPWTDGDPY